MFEFTFFSEIGIENNRPKEFSPELDLTGGIGLSLIPKPFSAIGNCYASCFPKNITKITLHSIMGLGSRNVQKMQIVKLTNDKMEESCENCNRNLFRLKFSIFSFENRGISSNLYYYSDALIYNENHVNTRYQPFKVIRSTQIEVLI